ncbi:envelope protein [Acidovorax phage Alfacinha1]|nr:envelope protein [Acidovorax phage Alfacinha3]UYL85521.1 envelope protein [Acidovorax phage Alfacinha1]
MTQYLLTIAAVLACLVLAWCLIPSLCVLALPGVPLRHRTAAALSFLRASVRGLVMLPADLLAPIVVPFALLQTRWEAEALPRWARWWDNDVGINGDKFEWIADAATGVGVPQPVPLADTIEARALCYWAPGHHPRSRWARWVWLGLRNRASAMALQLGRAADYSQPVETWGDVATGRGHAGWVLRHHAGAYQLYATRRLGGLCLRTNYGHKVDVTVWKREVLPVVCITASLLSWKEPQEASLPATE